MGILFSFITAVSFSISSIYIKRGLRYGTSDSAVFYTILTNVVFFWLLLGLFYRHEVGTYSEIGLAVFLVSGVLGPIFGRFTLYKSIEFIGASRSASLKIASPVFSVFLALLILGERLSWPSLLGIAIVLGGVYLLQGETQNTFGESENLPGHKISWGVFWGLFSALLFAATNVARKMGLGFISSAMAGSAVSTLGGLVAFSAYYLATGKMGEVVRINAAAFRYFFLGGVFTCFGLFSYFVALEHVTVAVAMTIANTEPLFTMAFSKLLGDQDEALNRSMLYSVLIILAGVVIIAFYR